MAYNFKDVTILIVEDMLPLLTLTKSLAQIFGFRNIFGAKNGIEAYKIYKKVEPDLIITDWLMADMDGLELIHKIRNDEDSFNPYIPIILMTGYTDKNRVELARDNGMTEYLAKPYTADDLYNKIVQTIEKPRKFVKCDMFMGPDRRRRETPYLGPIRRNDDYFKEQRKEMQNAADDIIARDKD